MSIEGGFCGSGSQKQMTDLSAVVRLRPARIALLVRPNDTRSVRRFMRISACMWGGIYNPIIPVFATRRAFGDEISKAKRLDTK